MNAVYAEFHCYLEGNGALVVGGSAFGRRLASRQSRRRKPQDDHLAFLLHLSVHRAKMLHAEEVKHTSRTAVSSSAPAAVLGAILRGVFCG